MKKTFLSFICLLSITATGFSQQKGNRLAANQSKLIFRDGVSLVFEQNCRLEINCFFQKESACNLFNTGNASAHVDYNLLCIPKQLFFDKMINQLIINQY